MRSFIFIVFVLLYPLVTNALLNPPQSISLMPKEGYETLELGNSLWKLCPMKDKALFDKCSEEKLKSREFIISLYSTPNEKSKIIGKIRLVVNPLNGFESFYINEKNVSQKFKSDLGSESSDYGPQFVFTVKEIKGDWIELPKRPFPEHVWINPKKDFGSESEISPTPMTTSTGYYSRALGSIIITKFNGNMVTYRKENEADFNCEGKEVKISPEELKEFTIKIEKFYDEDEHLTVWDGHIGGC